MPLQPQSGRARAKEGFEHKTAEPGERGHQRLDNLDNLLGGMVAFAAVGPCLDIRERYAGAGRPPFCREVSRFVPAFQKSGARYIVLAQDDMAYRPERRLFSCAHKGIHMGPSVERDTEGIGFEKTAHFPECRSAPVGTIVVIDSASCAIREQGRILRIGDHEVYARVGKAAGISIAVLCVFLVPCQII